MNNSLKHFGLITLTAVLLAGCASTGERETSESRVAEKLQALNVTRGDSVRSVSEFRIDGWHSIDDRNLILTAGVHDHYLVELAGICPDLRGAFWIGLENRTTSLTRLDSIVVNSMHQRLDKCQIQEIYRLNDIS